MKKKNNNVLLLLLLILILVSLYYFKTMEDISDMAATDTVYPTTSVSPQISKPSQVVPANSTTDVKPKLNVISPNGGESIELNTLTKIKWGQYGLNSSDLLSIAFRDKDWDVCWVGKISATLGETSFTPKDVKCQVGSTMTSLRVGEKYILQLLADKYTDGMGLADQSDASFTIVR